MSFGEIVMLCFIVVIGYLMVFFWLCVEDYEVDLLWDCIYDLFIKDL